MDELNRISRISNGKQDIIQRVKGSKNLVFVCCGNNRVIARIRGKNKICKISDSRYKNSKEIKIYENKESLRRYLCPIYDSGKNNNWIISPRVSIDVPREKKISLLKEMIEKISMIPKQITLNEIGLLNNRLVIVDYGFGIKEDVSYRNIYNNINS